MENILGNRYKIEEKIGSGGMAIVYKAKDTLLNRPVAVKILREQFVSDEGFVRRFRREAQSAASLSHPNIVSIYDVGKENDNDYIVMEYVHGRTLKDMIRERGPLPVSEALFIIRQIGEALAHAHANEIIHRDIKPQNILVTPEGRIKVTDFGIARAVSAATLTHTGDIVGSVHYLSPEQAKGDQTTAQSDIYSLGIILYELVTGRVPYDGDTPITVALKHIQDIPELPGKLVSGISKQLDDIIMKAIAKNTNDRYKDIQELMEDINKLENGQKIEAVRLSPDESLSATRVQKRISPTGRNDGKKLSKPLIVGLALLGVFLIAGLVYGLNSFFSSEVKVPDLKGKTAEEAQAELDEQKLVMGTISKDYSSTYTLDTIMDQDPSPDSWVKENRPINITLSLGPEFLKMPDVTTGAPTKDEAEKMILDRRFSKEKIKYYEVASTTVSQGRVVSQDPSAGASWNPNSEVRIFISSGAGPSTMPNLIGLDLAVAKDSLAGYNIDLVARRSYDYNVNIVIETEPTQGRPIKPGDKIEIIYSQGPGPDGA
ncbi:serine/threonine protein kinase with PASTA sensor(s) [Syntrophobotulus glycolicus DSM 8271]|uniref:non-specific serine/threonine protein kinase n=1 Tax=Syntrophobotulus glycolicus (strain DSM 8271 / FlGlyR) TaxID=645991 RepID=F0SUQ6_SYNGF|nr:Stk1 family PASTA domain-containing Ser/Thr kinase [Syntrophobotulus glycolicus]ADY56622.1 serine/threonine protein kinase with PASTA sensor(s) [Syntrophobotulus glycolicus DSM 8271]